MKPIDIIVLIIALGIVGLVIGNYIYRKAKKLPTGECASCTLKSEKMLKKIRKELRKNK